DAGAENAGCTGSSDGQRVTGDEQADGARAPEVDRLSNGLVVLWRQGRETSARGSDHGPRARDRTAQRGGCGQTSQSMGQIPNAEALGSGTHESAIHETRHSDLGDWNQAVAGKVWKMP